MCKTVLLQRSWQRSTVIVHCLETFVHSDMMSDRMSGRQAVGVPCVGARELDKEQCKHRAWPGVALMPMPFNMQSPPA